MTDQPLDSAIELVYVRTSLSLAFFLSYGVEQAGMSYQEQQEVLQNNLGREVKLDWQKKMSTSCSAQIIWLLDVMEAVRII